MKTVVSFLTLTLVLCSFCLAADHPVKTYKTGTTGMSSEMTKVSHDGFAAMRAIRTARIAIFNGETQIAIDLLNTAKDNLQTAYKDASTYFESKKHTTTGKVGTVQTPTVNMDWIPIDGQVSLSESFVPSPKKAEHIAKANKFFKNSQNKEAIRELRLGEIDVTYTVVLMPWEATMKCVTEAMNLVNDQKYYEANLALKTAEDGLIVDSTTLFDTPQTTTK